MKSGNLLKTNVLLCFFSFMVVSLGFLFYAGAQADKGEEKTLLEQAQRLFKPLPKDMSTPEFPINPERVDLGRTLFFDPRPSLDGTVSCARCHQPSLYGTDALPKSIGAENRLNAHNAPTVLNAALQFVEHWYGDRSSVEDQATKSLVGLASFGNPNHTVAIAKIKAISAYQHIFAKAFPNEKDPITPANWGKAIGAYERTLVTPSPFDAYLKSDTNTLTPEARAGLREFINVGCISCHNGIDIGGGMFQKFGVFEEYWKATGSKEIDKGRYNMTKNTADLYVFKVPSLRNVAMTPPYFHDGSVTNLPEAVRIMAEVQLGKKLSDKQVRNIVAFLNSLTGILPKDFTIAPMLPPAAFSVSR
jgi:cytochrome c peroxidase